MAAVYAATHRNGARAALKILHPTLCTDEGVCERFLGEGYLTNSVKHPGIVRVLDDGVTDDGCVFLVMDLLEGKTLEALRQDRGGQIELGETLEIADKLMDVLEAVHQAGIIHRDLKPQNVFICDDGSVKLLDFGVARVFDNGAQSKLSMFGLVLGTPSFMSPEQALGARDKVDHRSDIWSLGATMFTALTGQTVHLGPHVQAKLLAAASVQARSITMVMQDLPAPIAHAIDTALRFKQEDRWQSVDAFRRALRDAQARLGIATSHSVRPPGWVEATDHESEEWEGPTRVKVPAKAHAVAALLPEAGAESPPVPPPIESSPNGQDVSYPAVGSTLKFENQAGLLAQVQARRSVTAVWLSGVMLAVIASSGVAFFAVKRPRHGAVMTGASTVSSAATAAAGGPSSPSPVTHIAPRDFMRDASVPIESPIKAAVTPAPPRAGHPGAAPVVPPGVHIQRIPAPAPPSAQPTASAPPPATEESAASPTPTVPPDPFGTPE